MKTIFLIGGALFVFWVFPPLAAFITCILAVLCISRISVTIHP